VRGTGYVEGDGLCCKHALSSEFQSHFVSRYRSTAVLITLILEGGFCCPHRTLDKYVEVFTGFRPTDGKRWTDPPVLPEPPLSPVLPEPPLSPVLPEPPLSPVLPELPLSPVLPEPPLRPVLREPQFPPDFTVEDKVAKLVFDDLSKSSASWNLIPSL
jgi:hypothetical protein